MFYQHWVLEWKSFWTVLSSPLPPCHIWLYLVVTWYHCLPSNQRLQLPCEWKCCSLLEVSGSPAICRGCGEVPTSMSISWRSQREHSYKEMRNKAEWTCATGPRHTFQYAIRCDVKAKSPVLLLLSRFSRVRLCDPIDGSPPGSPVPGILQATTLEWVAISFSSAWKWKVKVKSLSRAQLLATPWTAAYQAPLSMGFSRQEYWSRVPLPCPPIILITNNFHSKNHIL